MKEAAAWKQLNKKVDLKSLTPAQARVEIAKDVIAALKVGKIKAGWGYGTLELASGAAADESLREHLPAMKSCEVCAIGAALVACVARENKFNIDPGAFSREDSTLFFEREDVVDRMKSYFSKSLLGRIEEAFEVDGIYASVGREWTAEEAFGKAFDNRADRLTAIMGNIVANNGAFLP